MTSSLIGADKGTHGKIVGTALLAAFGGRPDRPAFDLALGGGAGPERGAGRGEAQSPRRRRSHGHERLPLARSTGAEPAPSAVLEHGHRPRRSCAPATRLHR